MIGAALGLVIFAMRMWIPESPRWLLTHGHPQRAEATIVEIERRYARSPLRREELPRPRAAMLRLRTRTHTPLVEVARTLLRTYPRRTLVGLSLMASQAFFYNAI